MALRALQGPTGGGAPVGGGGTSSPSTIPRWTGASTLGDSVITQSGTFIGVGVPTPAYPFQVQTLAANTNTISLINGTGNLSRLGWVQNGSTTLAYTAIDGDGRATGYMSFLTAAAERMRIDSSGALLVGTQTNPLAPNTKLMVSDANLGKGFEFRPGATGTVLVYDRTGGTFLPTDWQSTTFRLSQTAATFDASTAGAGLKLPATPGNTDPNTLDCYADGGTANSGGVTWTPAVTFGGASTGVTYSTQVGRYTRIGNMVCATCYVVLSSKGTATGNVKITGLPTSSNTSNLFTAATVGYFANITSTGQVMGYMSPNDTGVILNQTTPVGSSSALTDANFANNSTFIMTIAYPVT